MTEKSAEDFIPGLDELDEPPKSVVNLNINDTRIADVKAQLAGVDATKDFKSAKAAAKTCQQMRATLTDAHKQQKAESLAFGRTLDAEKNRLLSLIGEIEDPIRAQIEEIETAEKRKEEERIDAIEQRMEDLREYGQDLDGRELSELQDIQELLNALEITDEDFQEFREAALGAKAEAESRLRIAIGHAQTREEEEARLEEQRKGQEAQQAELDKQQAELDAQAYQLAKDQIERDRKAREDQQAKDTERQAELDKKQEEIDRQNREREERERVEKEAAEKEAAAARAAELAPDKEKLDKLAGSLEQLEMPKVQSQQAEDVLTYVRSEIRNLVRNIQHYGGEME